MNETLAFLNKLLKLNDTIIIGVSGGPDSMCLLHTLISLKEEKNLKIICAHINHGLRVESNEEKIFVEEYSKKKNIIFEYMKIEEYTNDKFTENEARRKRYAFFEELIKKYNAKYLMTAHHGDDLIETTLMRIVRGSTLSGFIGIPKISVNKKYKIVRPLLYTTKEDIYKYLEENNIPYVLDKTNESDKYTRNRYRKHMLPFLKNEEENVHLKFLKYSEELEKYNNYINNIVKEKIRDIIEDNKILVDKILKEDKFIQERIIEYAIKDIQKYDIFNINNKGMENIIELLKNKENKEVHLSDNYIARKSYNYLIIEKNKNKVDYQYKLEKEIKVLNKYKFEIIEESNLKNNYVLRLNSKEIKLPLYIRNKNDGDKIKVKNLNGTKKVKDIFIDSKIDLKKREEYPLLIDSDNNIIWIPGIKKSIFDKDINEKYDIIIKYTEEKNE